MPQAPPPADRPHPVLQQRSRETVERLLDAAEATLRDEGCEGATLRAISERAGAWPACNGRDESAATATPRNDAIARQWMNLLRISWCPFEKVTSHPT